jgi:hypothetical protein
MYSYEKQKNRRLPGLEIRCDMGPFESILVAALSLNQIEVKGKLRQSAGHECKW